MSSELEFNVNEGYTVGGELIGHLVKGAMMVNDTAKKLGISSETVTLLEHMILSLPITRRSRYPLPFLSFFSNNSFIYAKDAIIFPFFD